MADHEQQSQHLHLHQQNMQGNCPARAKWYGVLKSIAYELRPFTLPTKGDLQQAVQLANTNAEQIRAEGERLAPEIWKVVKSLEPAKAAIVLGWLCGWVGFIWLEFGAVYFIISAMAMIFANLGERGEGEWSAYSVFNAGCKALLGTINAEQFEREMMHQNPAGPPLARHNNEPGHELEPEEPEDREYVFVDPVQNQNEEALAEENDDRDEEDEDESDTGEEGDGGALLPPGAAAGPAARARRVSGKRARRGFEERRERQEERRLALEAFGHEQWD